MIDEKKLIEEMQEQLDYLDETKSHPADFVYKNGFLLAIDIVNDQPKVTEWIPVTERLPETEERVIGTFKGVNEENIVLAVYFHPRFLKAPLPMVAWMPLPEPYKGE